MAAVKVIKTLEELSQFLNEKGIFEIAIRGKNKKFRTFQKIALDNLQSSEATAKVEQAIGLLNKNHQIAETGLKMLNGVAALSKLNLVLSGLNLCATCAGFAIMYAKLDKLSAQINEIVTLHKNTESVHINYVFNKILSEHSNMLDCRKTQNYYSVDQMRTLVAQEYDALELLTEVFSTDISGNQETLIFSMLSLASMLSVSLKYFDETYYFKYKDVVGDGEVWHLDHDKWMSIFDKLSSKDFIEKIQDCGFFDMGLNTIENDCFYMSFFDQVRGLKQDVEDNQALISAVGDPEIFRMMTEKMNEEIRNEIENAFTETGADIGLCKKALQAAAV